MTISEFYNKENVTEQMFRFTVFPFNVLTVLNI